MSIKEKIPEIYDYYVKKQRDFVINEFDKERAKA